MAERQTRQKYAKNKETKKEEDRKSEIKIDRVEMSIHLL